ncbi:asparagine synthase (glutamine-hydrolyzing) [bacterium]|nr:asparagine synthase (glutamine-hydrolyzing) [bacterium]
MCGIVGFFDPERRVKDPEESLRRMTLTLERRGPDDMGFFHSGPWHLGHRRLSILDLSAAGHQPMLSEDGRTAVVFNGEIYNFQDLRAWLEGRGYRFRTRTDTEVLLHIYKEEAEASLARLNGMFGFGILDLDRGRLLLARDRAGKKPLYYTRQNGLFAFASELKALAALGELDRAVDPESVRLFLGLDYIPSPRTIYRSIRKVRSGHYLVFDGKDIREEPYWQLRYVPKLKAGSQEMAEELTGRIRDAVKTRLVADVPVGVLLSGGIDSSAVAYFAQENASQKIRTFSIRFDDPSYDESRHARRVADHLGTDHTEFSFTVRDALSRIESVFAYLDEPFADPSILPTALLCENTVKNVTVALGGDGGDELFYGYPTYQAEALARALGPARWAAPILRGVAGCLPASDKYMSWPFKLERFFRGLAANPVRRHFLWRGPCDPGTLDALMGENGTKDLYGDLAAEVSSNRPYGSVFEPVLYNDFRFYLQDGVLVKVDRASMMHSLEVRAPLLDQRVMEYAARLPRAVNFGGFQTKSFFKSILRGKLPDEIIDRPKKGFAVPVSSWLKTDLREMFLDLWPTGQNGLIRPDAVRSLYEEHAAGRRDRRKELWALLAFGMWRRNHL